MKKIGIFGGTFDPIHIGHIIIAKDLREKFELNKVLLVPAWEAPHKRRKKSAAPEHRLEMTALALKGRKGLAVSDFEIHRGGDSYSIDTVRHFIAAGSEITFFAGTDAIPWLPSWREIDALVKLCKFVLVKRPGFQASELDAIKPELKSTTFRALKSNLIDVRQIEISSTEIRHRVRDGLVITHLVPPDVARYIQAKRLYRK